VLQSNDSISKFRILLAEDEASLRDMIALNLELEGYAVQTALDGKAALEKALSERFDLLVLDVMLPLLDGFRLCERVRLENSEVMILFLTARNTGEDRVQGLRLGADDYLTKPFNLEELLLRVAGLLRRGLDRKSRQQQSEIFRFDGHTVNFVQFEILTRSGERIHPSKREMQLLKLLIERSNEVVSRKQILETVWGYDIIPATRTIDNFILNFRKYFERNPAEPEFFQSVRGVGYRFVLPAER
jgi:two-component system alkaline phosphatase synthesis response regulator PhoP